MAKLTFEIYEELGNTLMKLVPLSFWQADQLLRDVLEKPNEDGHKRKAFITLLIVPRNTQRGDVMEHLRSVIVIMKFTIKEQT